jgi:hypothetical protein
MCNGSVSTFLNRMWGCSRYRERPNEWIQGLFDSLPVIEVQTTLPLSELGSLLLNVGYLTFLLNKTVDNSINIVDNSA